MNNHFKNTLNHVIHIDICINLIIDITCEWNLLLNVFAEFKMSTATWLQDIINQFFFNSIPFKYQRVPQRMIKIIVKVVNVITVSFLNCYWCPQGNLLENILWFGTADYFCSTNSIPKICNNTLTKLWGFTWLLKLITL